MAYGLKYELLCTSRINANAHKLKLYFDGYVGSDINRNMPATQPLLLKKDKAAVVRGTSLEFAIREEVDFEFDEFYTNNPKKIKAELYTGSTLIWAGYNLPQQYQAPYVPVPANIRFTATDGLGLLKNESFTLTGTNSQLATIIHCIDKIGLGLGYSIAINLFETTHNHTYTPLAQTYEDAAIYEDNNCYDVIEKILQKYDAEITQLNGRWHITCSADKKSTRMLYTTAGVYETTEAAPAVLDLGYPGAGIEAWPVGQLSRSLEPGGKKVILKHNYGRKDSLLTLKNYDFTEFSGGQFTGWTQVGTFTLEQKTANGKPYAFLTGGAADGTHQIYREIAVENAADDFYFQLDYAPIGKNTVGGIGSIFMTVRVMIRLVAGATTYYLTEDGEWTTTSTTIAIQVRSSISSPVWNKLKIVANGLPASGTIRVCLFRYNNTETPETGDEFTGVAFSNPYTYFTDSGQLYPSSVSTLAIFDNSTEPDDLGTIELSAADAPALFNNSLLYLNITRRSDNVPTTVWHRLGSVTEYLFIVQLARTLASRSRIARQVLKGIIKGTGLNFGSIIKHTYNSSREFEIAEGAWDLYNETWDGTLLELLAWSDEAITFTSTAEKAATKEQSASGAVVAGITGNDAGNTSNNYLKIINEGQANAYMRCTLPFAGDYEIQAYSDNGQLPAGIWDSMPIASATVLGGIKVGSGLAITAGVLRVEGNFASTWGTITGTLSNQTDLNNALGAKADLVGGVVPSAQLPSFVDDILEYANYAALPGTGEAGKIYVTLDTNLTYRWSGTAYVEISQSLALGETLSTAYRGDRGATAYAHTSLINNPHTVTATQVGLGNVTNESKATMFTNPTFTGAVVLESLVYFQKYSSSPDEGIKYDAPGRAAGWYGVHDFYTGYNGGASALAVRIKNLMVGIGTTPNSMLDIASTARSGSHNTGCAIYATATSAAGSGGIEFRHTNGTQGLTMGYNTISGTGSNADVDVGFKAKGVGAVYLGTDSGLYNTTYSGYKAVHLGGLYLMSRENHDGYIGSNLYYSSTPTWCNKYSTYKASLIGFADGEITFYTGTGITAGSTSSLTTKMTLTNTGNLNVVGEVTAYYSSDTRLKENFQKFSGLAKIDSLYPIAFRWNEKAKELNTAKDDRINYGLIAQEVEKNMPELVHTIYDRYKSVDYVQLVPVLIQAIKELKAEINSLRNAS